MRPEKPETHRDLRYRPDIDGLRSLAIVPVVMYHIGIAGFSGGYVGVDVFFVISGYLITTIIARELQAGDFSFRRFWLRRARRLLPAMLAVTIATLLLGMIWFLPQEFGRIGQSVFYNSFFASNFYFWDKTGYFTDAAIVKPLLHTWSLSVEEQYYLVLPLMLSAVFFLIRTDNHLKHVVWLVAVLTAGSFGLNLYVTEAAPEAAFYLLPMRAWELFIGSLAACYMLNRPHAGTISNGWLAQVVGLCGLALIAGSVVFYDDDIRFPGIWAAAPCLGALCIIICDPRNALSNRLLSGAVPVFIGKISYSLYLWHWPLIVFVSYRVLEDMDLIARLASSP